MYIDDSQIATLARALHVVCKLRLAIAESIHPANRPDKVESSGPEQWRIRPLWQESGLNTEVWLQQILAHGVDLVMLKRGEHYAGVVSLVPTATIAAKYLEHRLRLAESIITCVT